MTAATAAPATLCDWQGKNRSPAIKAYIKTLAGEFSKFCACAHRCWRQPEGLSALHCYNFTATPLPSAIVNRYTFSDICDPNHTKKGDAIAIVDVVDQQWQYARGQPVTPSPLEQTVICGFISSYCTSDDKFVMIQVISTCVYSAASNFHSPRGARFQLVQPGFAGATMQQRPCSMQPGRSSSSVLSGWSYAATLYDCTRLAWVMTGKSAFTDG